MSTSKVDEKTDEIMREMNIYNAYVTPFMDSQDYKEVLDFLYKNNGFLTKCVDENGDIEGFLVRTECPGHNDVIFINYRPIDIYTTTNILFEKGIAIMQTFKKGLRYIKKNFIEDVTFEKYISDLDETEIFNDGLVCIGSVSDFLAKNFNLDSSNVMITNDNRIISKNLYAYMKVFEKKARKYYKENVDKKTFITLPI